MQKWIHLGQWEHVSNSLSSLHTHHRQFYTTLQSVLHQCSSQAGQAEEQGDWGAPLKQPQPYVLSEETTGQDSRHYGHQNNQSILHPKTAIHLLFQTPGTSQKC